MELVSEVRGFDRRIRVRSCGLVVRGERELREGMLLEVRSRVVIFAIGSGIGGEGRLLEAMLREVKSGNDVRSELICWYVKH